jgi:8-oxo-dGTP pyrophosphatase MutT (NUDIX family)
VPTSVPLPKSMIQRARDFTGPPAAARAAATVVLLRPEADSFQAYLLRRAATMAFGGVYAFPGGGVDETDRPELINDDWAERLGVPDPQARAVVGAAARELFEEAGVLLAGRSDELDHTVGDVSTPEWEADRQAVAGRSLTMTELLAKHDLRLRDDLLFPWSRWITPEFEPKRYDTWFFVALLPQAQTARDVSGEADRTTWAHPAATAELVMLPPTRSTLNDLCPYKMIEEVVVASGSRNAATPVMPRVERTDAGEYLLVLDQPKRPVM